MTTEQIISQFFHDKRIFINEKTIYFNNGKLEIQELGNEHIIYGQYSLILKENKICLITNPAILNDSKIITIDIVLGGQVVLEF
jgi:hypothetical protein